MAKGEGERGRVKERDGESGIYRGGETTSL